MSFYCFETAPESLVQFNTLAIPAKPPTLSSNSEPVYPRSLPFSNSSPVPLFPVIHQLDQCPRNVIAQVSLKDVVSTRLQQLPCLCLGLTHRHSKQPHKLHEVPVGLLFDDEHAWLDVAQVSQVLR